MAASEVDAREAPSEDVGSGQKPFAAGASPLASEMRAAKTVVGAESETVGPRTPAMSDEADGGDGDDVEDSFDLDEDGEHAEGEDDLDLTAEMARLAAATSPPETGTPAAPDDAQDCPAHAEITS